MVMSVPVIEFRNVTCRYGATNVLENINLHLHKGQFAGILGPSGAGKTTLLKAVLGLIVPAEGEVLIGGQALRGRPSRRGAYVAQGGNVQLEFSLSAVHNLLIG